MLAEHLPRLLQLQNRAILSYMKHLPISIPVIRNGRNITDNDLLYSVKRYKQFHHYILTKCFETSWISNRLYYKTAVGRKPLTLDMDGWDAVGINGWFFCYMPMVSSVKPTNNHISVQWSPEHTKEQMRLWVVRKTRKFVWWGRQKLKNGKKWLHLCCPVCKNWMTTAFVKNEYNGFVCNLSSFPINNSSTAKALWFFSTTSAVLSDISALRYHYQYEYKKLYAISPVNLPTIFILKVYVEALMIGKWFQENLNG